MFLPGILPQRVRATRRERASWSCHNFTGECFASWRAVYIAKCLGVFRVNIIYALVVCTLFTDLSTLVFHRFHAFLAREFIGSRALATADWKLGWLSSLFPFGSG